VLHRLVEAEGVRIGKLAVFLETLPQIRALHVMKAARVATVVPGEETTLRVEFDAERVATAFRKNLEAARLGMIAPDPLPDHVRNRFLIQTRPRDVRRDGAAMRAVEPAIGTPA
jgi:hypothetical protein